MEELKISTDYYDLVVTGRKNFEVRKNDRPGVFVEGNTIQLNEFDPQTKTLTGRSCQVRIGYVLDNPNYNLPGTVTFSIYLL